MLAIAFLGLGAVEKNKGDFWMASEECRKVIWNERFMIDIGVQAAFPAACPEHVPQRDPGRFQRMDSLLVRQGRVGAEQFADDAPEQVAGMRIVLARPERRLARDAAQDEDSCVRIFDGCETLYVPHS